MNIAYKHLEAKLRVGELTLAQWLGIFVGAVTALMWALYVSPFGTSITIFTACYIGGLPAAAIFLATMSELDIVLLVRSALRWRREKGRYLPGPGATGDGYVVRADPAARARRDAEPADIDLTVLWEG